MNGAYFCLRTNLTVSGSTTVVDATLSATPEHVSGFTRQFLEPSRSNENLTSSAVMSLPSWNLIPGLILTVQVRPSADVSGRPSAASGTYSTL